MIDHQRQRELAMQVTLFLDGANDFPFDLTDEERPFVDRLVAVQEMLLADSHRRATAAEVVARVASATARNSPEMGVRQQTQRSDSAGKPHRTTVEEDSLPDPSVETCDDRTETIDGRE